ncbi:MAG: NAD(P)/FAD-dependent oxidoreductase [Hyphomonadaceae bacterium]
MKDAARPTRRSLKADVAIVGAGSAGLVAASGAAQLGLKVVLFEKGAMGGDCLNYGCVPSKALIAAGRAAQAARDAHRLGVHATDLHVQWSDVSAHVRGAIQTIAPNDSQERFEGLGVTVIRESAAFADERTLVSESVEVRARKIAIATGARAFIPPIPGLVAAPYLTNETVFDLRAPPSRLLILGAGAIGVELGQAFRRLGVDVVLVEAKDMLVSADPEARAVVRERLELEGVAIRDGADVVRVEHGDDEIALILKAGSVEERVAGSHLLVAAGRRPVVEGLDLERAGVAHDARGIRTDAQLRTSNRRVWALGDVAGREQFTHVAGAHGSLFVRNALFRVSPGAASAIAPPRTVFAEPELAEVGLSEEAARARYGARLRVVRWSFEENDRAITERAAEGFAKLIVAPGGRVVGGVVVGEGAGELIALVQFAIANKNKIGQLASGFLPGYPTRTEALKRAAGQYYAGALFSKPVRAAVSILSRLP